MILLLVTAGILIAFVTYISANADEKAAEELCRSFNVLRFGTQLEVAGVKVNTAPRACKTIDKGDIPNKDYANLNTPKDGAKAQIRGMMAKCWYMWLEGRQTNMMDTSTLSLSSSSNKCFACYDFVLQKDAGSISMNELLVSLEDAYIAKDSSDRCAAGGGGYCKSSCDGMHTKESVSIRCKENQKCCVNSEATNECINKGGKCSTNLETGYARFDKWQCKTGNCFVKQENFGSYLDYLQGTGAGEGRGYLVFQENFKGFEPGKMYGITLVSPGNSWSWGTSGFVGGAAFVVLGAGAITYFTGFNPHVISGGIAATTYTVILAQGSGTPNINFLYISDYDSIKDKCAVQAGVGQA